MAFCPEKSVISDLYPEIIGLWFSVVDHTQGDTPNGDYHLPQGVNDLAASFVDFILAEPDGRIPDISAVESVTWGRIKASFREQANVLKRRYILLALLLASLAFALDLLGVGQGVEQQRWHQTQESARFVTMEADSTWV